MDDLDKLRQPVSVQQVRQIIYAAVKDDKRYADFKRGIIRNPEMDINHIKTVFLEAAQDNGDFVGEPKLSKNSLKAARAIEAAKKGGIQPAHPAPKPPTVPPAAAQGAAQSSRTKTKPVNRFSFKILRELQTRRCLHAQACRAFQTSGRGRQAEDST